MAGIFEQYDDGALIRAIRSGSEDARKFLVDRYLQSIYNVVFRIVGSEADAEDLVQETFLRVFERLDLYDEHFTLRNWLLKIATNLTLSHLRTQRRQKKLQQDFGRSGIKQSEVSMEPGEWEQCCELLDRLEKDQRAVIVLFHFQQMSYADVARVMDIPVNTVRTLLHRSRRRLRELMTRRVSIMETDV